MSGNMIKAPVVSAQSIGAQVARGELGGVTPFGAFGQLETAGAADKQIVWPNGAFTFPNQVTGETISLVSTDDEDGAGTQTGINSVEVHYLDVNLEPKQKTVTLTGTTAVVAAIAGVRFIQCMHIQTAGSLLSAKGTIKAYREGAPAVVFSLINATRERCESSLRMVPAGKRAVITGLATSSVSGTAAARSLIELAVTEIDTHQYLDPFILIPIGSIGVQDAGVAYSLPTPVVARAGSVIGFRATTDKAAIISADWFGWIEDAGA